MISIIIGPPMYTLEKPKIEYHESEPHYKNWPRDCSLVSEFKIVLNRRAQIEYGDILEKWLKNNISDYSIPRTGIYILKTPEDVALYKLSMVIGS